MDKRVEQILNNSAIFWTDNYSMFNKAVGFVTEDVDALSGAYTSPHLFPNSISQEGIYIDMTTEFVDFASLHELAHATALRLGRDIVADFHKEECLANAVATKICELFMLKMPHNHRWLKVCSPNEADEIQVQKAYKFIMSTWYAKKQEAWLEAI